MYVVIDDFGLVGVRMRMHHLHMDIVEDREIWRWFQESWNPRYMEGRDKVLMGGGVWESVLVVRR